VAGGLIILDRDGVINQDSDEFIKTPDEWVPLEGSLEAIAALSSAGFEVAIASNQSGIGRKLIDGPALEGIHRKMQRMVREAGGDIGRIVFCPHHPDDGCQCRKPAPGLLLDLSRHYGVALVGVPIVGDSLRDIEAAIAVGGRPILVLTGNGQTTAEALRRTGESVETYANLQDAAHALIEERRRR
jgi:D-glycero-D-manno-heptose 1,7-bisphosphate phosphatase